MARKNSKRLPVSQNKDHGFYGTLKNSRLPAEQLYTAAVALLISLVRDLSERDAIEYLDSTSGRHMADHVVEQAEVLSPVRALSLVLKRAEWQRDVRHWMVRNDSESFYEV